MARTPDDAVHTAMAVVMRLQHDHGLEAVVSTRPPGLEVVLGKYTLKRRLGLDETDVEGLTREVFLYAEGIGLMNQEHGT